MILFFIEYGKRGVIDNLYEVGPTVLGTEEREKLLKNFGKKPTTDQALFSDYPEEDKQQNIFDPNYYMYDTINSIICKIILPKKIGSGKIGLYIPKLKNGNAFSIYSKNLDSTSQKSALLMFKSIRYK